MAENRTRLSIELTAEQAKLLEQYDRAVYEMGVRLVPEVMAGRPFHHDVHSTLRALMIDAIGGLPQKIAETEKRGADAKPPER